MASTYELPLHMQRAGELLIRCIWLEKRLIDLMILRDHPDLVNDFNNGTISEKHAQLRLEMHKHTFAFIIKPFFEKYPEVEQTDPKHIENLYALNELRDMLSHADISYHRENLLFVPKSEARRTKFDELTKPERGERDDGTRVLTVNDEKFEVISVILNDWEKIIEDVAKHHGVDPHKIK